MRLKSAEACAGCSVADRWEKCGEDLGGPFCSKKSDGTWRYGHYEDVERQGGLKTTDSKPGKKADNGKPRIELLPFSVLVEISKVLTHGANKYVPDNWQNVPDAKNRYTGALMRHLAAWKEGEAVDPESGEDKLLHIAQVACNALFLVWFETHDSKLEDKNEKS
jgi:hypothetical protein